MNIVGTIVAALGGSGAIAGLVAAITAYFKTKTAAEERKKETSAAHKKMAEDMEALRIDISAINTTMQKVVGEATALREDNAAKDRKIIQQDKIIMQQAAALPPAIKPIKKD